MRKILGIVFCLLLVSKILFAGGGEYAVANIPVNLLKNANAVLRDEALQVNIIATDNVEFSYRFVLTILNEKADKFADFSISYNKENRITFAMGYLYDAAGNEIKKVKLKDMDDLSGISDNNLYEDSRIKYHSFHHKVYPYTIEYKFKIVYGNSLFFPAWIPQNGAYEAVEKSTAEYICDKDYQFRFKAFNYKEQPKTEISGDKKSFTWSVKDLPAIRSEVYSPPLHELTTMVIFGPTDFQMDAYKGNMKSWQDFGKFIYSLKAGRDELPENIKQKVHQLTDGIKDEKTKVDTLYRFLQKTTRYISIQLGIGGWQPFDAKYVASKAYGDCKALTNYMYSLLKEAGIKSYYTVIRAGENDRYITADFPSQQFTHVILFVPLAKDTIWLECTNANMPPGYLGSFTCNRNALMIDANGGKLIHTPNYGIDDNTAIRKMNATLDEEGNLNLKTNTKYIGLQQDFYRYMINALPKDKQKRYLQQVFDFATYEIDGFNYSEQNEAMPSIVESLDITARNYATLSGKRLFIKPNLMTMNEKKFEKDEKRLYDIVIQSASREIDSVTIKIPDGYKPEYIPAAVQLEKPFGKYQISMSVKNNEITCYRLLEQYDGRFPAADYHELVEFYQAIYKADRNKIVLVKASSDDMDF
ncbi:MAG: DUF3857 domain-containing protein [Chitinophagaceae bacterium]|nr:DUF3857 domain-containing protein [Chitinophagaceae bacterium]